MRFVVTELLSEQYQAELMSLQQFAEAKICIERLKLRRECVSVSPR